MFRFSPDASLNIVSDGWEIEGFFRLLLMRECLSPEMLTESQIFLQNYRQKFKEPRNFIAFGEGPSRKERPEICYLRFNISPLGERRRTNSFSYHTDAYDPLLLASQGCLPYGIIEPVKKIFIYTQKVAFDRFVLLQASTAIPPDAYIYIDTTYTIRLKQTAENLARNLLAEMKKRGITTADNVSIVAVGSAVFFFTFNSATNALTTDAQDTIETPTAKRILLQNISHRLSPPPLPPQQDVMVPPNLVVTILNKLMMETPPNPYLPESRKPTISWYRTTANRVQDP